MNEKQKKTVLYVIYAAIVFLIFAFLVWLGHFNVFQQFVTRVENSSFDLRQTMILPHKKANPDIVVLTVDDETYEYIMDKYGSWPISRRVWADVINALETARPKYIIFDMLFIKPNLADTAADKYFVDTVRNNKNVYLSMNFDNYSEDTRKAVDLNDKFKLKIKDGFLFDSNYVTFSNCRTLMSQLLDATKNVGIINVTRDEDGIIRNTTPIFKYKDKYYPNLSFRVALDLLKKNEISIINNTIIIDAKHKIPLDETQRAILNWYGKSSTFTHIPLWQLLKAMKENDSSFIKSRFADRIIYVGTTTTSLSDIKSSPVESHMAGVELHTTFLNNILDNNFIKKSSPKFDFLISIIISLFVGYFVLITPSVLKTYVILFTMLVCYGIYATYGMLFFNIWIPVVLPVISAIVTFILIYCEKYLLKVKDYEQTYKLAITDGLTQLYNHRYFQEQMIVNVSNFKRYNAPFSVILIDIDFFKKFNDTYGHQSGDAVLKQVASVLKKNIRTSDIACRYGGEEMSIILTSTAKKDAIVTAQKVWNAVRTNKFLLAGGERVNVTISVGVATVGENGTVPQEIIEHCDKCLYKAKESGRDQVVYEL